MCFILSMSPVKKLRITNGFSQSQNSTENSEERLQTVSKVQQLLYCRSQHWGWRELKNEGCGLTVDIASYRQGRETDMKADQFLPFLSREIQRQVAMPTCVWAQFATNDEEKHSIKNVKTEEASLKPVSKHCHMFKHCLAGSGGGKLSSCSSVWGEAKQTTFLWLEISRG